MKKNGGIIQNWQLHTIATGQQALDKVKEKHPNFDMDIVAVFTGTVKESETRKVGNHLRSSVILTLDRETGLCETANTMYTLIDEGNDCVPDLGPGVMSIFY